jgi:hypothetical protein
MYARERDIHLKGVGEQEDAIDSGTSGHIHVVDGAVLLVHAIGPVRDRVAELDAVCNTKGQVDVRSSVLSGERSRAGQGGTYYAVVGVGGRDEGVTQTFSLFGAEHRPILRAHRHGSVLMERHPLQSSCW